MDFLCNLYVVQGTLIFKQLTMLPKSQILYITVV